MTPFSRFYKPANFIIQEFVDPETFKAHGEAAWRFIDPLLLMTMDRIRVRYGKPITINNWHTGGQFKFRGFRPPDCTEGAKLSGHRFGRSCDFDVVGMTAQAVRDDIQANPEHFDFNQINLVERSLNGKPISWVHIGLDNIPERIRFIDV